jgi:hypothetical protein
VDLADQGRLNVAEIEQAAHEQGEA